jgi:hypothetical protein
MWGGPFSASRFYEAIEIGYDFPSGMEHGEVALDLKVKFTDLYRQILAKDRDSSQVRVVVRERRKRNTTCPELVSR